MKQSKYRLSFHSQKVREKEIIEGQPYENSKCKSHLTEEVSANIAFLPVPSMLEL